VTRELYISRVAERLGIPREVVATEAAAKPRAAMLPSRPAAVPEQEGPPEWHREAQGRGERVAPRRAAVRTPGAEIERKLLRLLLTSPAWLARASGELPPDRFTVPTFARIYGALVALPDGAPVGDALLGLDPRAQEAWQALMESPPPGEGYHVDQEYAGALEALEEIHQFPEIAAEPDSQERSRRWRALSKEGQARFRMYLATAPRSRASRDDPPTEE